MHRRATPRARRAGRDLARLPLARVAHAGDPQDCANAASPPRTTCTGWQHWVPQVREGSKWMREGAASVQAPYLALAALDRTHAGEEQGDFKILFDDYRKAGGTVEDIDTLRRNPGGEALNSYLHALAATPNPLGLLGAIYVIEGTGQRIIPALLPLIKASLDLPAEAFRFLEYHGANDEHHLLRWLARGRDRA